MANVRGIPRIKITMCEKDENAESTIPSLREMTLCVLSHNGLFTPPPETYGVFMSGRYKWSSFADVKTDIELLLHHIVYARRETPNTAIDPKSPIDDFAEIEKLLDSDDSLLFQAADVITPSGLKVKGTTPYEAALGSGDPEMAQFIADYLNRTENGREEKARSDERYRPHIEQMMKREPYDINWLVDILIQASDKDVTALLNDDMKHESELRDAYIKYRQETMPGEIGVGMHCNYNNLLHLFIVIEKRFDEINKTTQPGYRSVNYDRSELFAKRIIGWEQGNLTSYERFLFAHGDTNPERTFKWKYNNGSFPASRRTSVARSGLGEKYWALFQPWELLVGPIGGSGMRREFTKLMSDKNSKLGRIMQRESNRHSPGCPVM